MIILPDFSYGLTLLNILSEMLSKIVDNDDLNLR
jgi:hypothetical protein